MNCAIFQHKHGAWTGQVNNQLCYFYVFSLYSEPICFSHPLLFLKLVFVYLEELSRKGGNEEEERETNLSSSTFLPRWSQWPVLGYTEAKAKSFSWVGHMDIGTQTLGLLFVDHQQGAELKMEHLGFKLAPLWDVSTAGSGFTVPQCWPLPQLLINNESSSTTVTGCTVEHSNLLRLSDSVVITHYATAPSPPTHTFPSCYKSILTFKTFTYESVDSICCSISSLFHLTY